MTALHRLGMLSIRLCKYSMDNDSRPRLRTSNNSSLFFGVCPIVTRLSWAHKFSMGLKYGDCAGHFITVTFLHSLSYLRDIPEPLHLCVLDVIMLKYKIISTQSTSRMNEMVY